MSRWDAVLSHTLVASLVIWALADGISPGRVVNQRVLAWDVPVLATQTLPAAAVQQSVGDDNLVQMLTGLVGDEVARMVSRNRGRIGAGLLVVAILGVALIVGLVVEMKKREARAVAALDRDRARGQKLRDRERARMRDEQS